MLSTPLISALHSLYPQGQVSLLCTKQSAQLLEHDPLLKQILIYDKRGTDRGLFGLLRAARRLRQLQFDRAYVLHRSWRTSVLIWLTRIPLRIGFKQARLSFLYQRLAKSRLKHQHEVLRNLALLEDELPDLEAYAELRLVAPPHQQLSAEIRSLALEHKRYVILVPGSAWRTKIWFWQGYRKVAEHYVQQGICVVLLGAASESALANKVAQGICLTNLVGKSSLGDMLYLIANARLLVCNDSLALHIASAFKTPTVVNFCSTLPQFGFGPWRNKAHVLELRDLECRPCGRHGHRHCPTGTEACMKGVSAQEVISAASSLLEVS